MTTEHDEGLDVGSSYADPSIEHQRRWADALAVRTMPGPIHPQEPWIAFQREAVLDDPWSSGKGWNWCDTSHNAAGWWWQWSEADHTYRHVEAPSGRWIPAHFTAAGVTTSFHRREGFKMDGTPGVVVTAATHVVRGSIGWRDRANGKGRTVSIHERAGRYETVGTDLAEIGHEPDPCHWDPEVMAFLAANENSRDANVLEAVRQARRAEHLRVTAARKARRRTERAEALGASDFDHWLISVNRGLAGRKTSSTSELLASDIPEVDWSNLYNAGMAPSAAVEIGKRWQLSKRRQTAAESRISSAVDQLEQALAIVDQESCEVSNTRDAQALASETL